MIAPALVCLAFAAPPLCPASAARVRALDAACTAAHRHPGADHGVTMRRLYRGACGRALRAWQRHASACSVLDSLPVGPDVLASVRQWHGAGRSAPRPPLDRGTLPPRPLRAARVAPGDAP